MSICSPRVCVYAYFLLKFCYACEIYINYFLPLFFVRFIRFILLLLLPAFGCFCCLCYCCIYMPGYFYCQRAAAEAPAVISKLYSSAAQMTSQARKENTILIFIQHFQNKRESRPRACTELLTEGSSTSSTGECTNKQVKSL